MNKIPLLRLVITASILYSLGLASCKKNYERLMFVKTISIDATSLVAKGEVTDVGAGTVEFGFCYGTNSNPDLGNSFVHNAGNTSSPVSFQADLSQVLISGTNNYVRSYAKSGQGTVYGEILKIFVATTTEYYWDDGTGETGWFYNKGITGYLGNLFPVSTSGNIISVKVMFKPADSVGTDKLTIEFFDKNRTHIGSTGQFYPSPSEWITVSGSNVPFSGNFYAMVFWNGIAKATNSLYEDNDGPNVNMDLAYYSDGTAWSTISSGLSEPPGIFLIRVTARITNGNKAVKIVEFSPVSDPGSPAIGKTKPSASERPLKSIPVSK